MGEQTIVRSKARSFCVVFLVGLGLSLLCLNTWYILGDPCVRLVGDHSLMPNAGIYPWAIVYSGPTVTLDGGGWIATSSDEWTPETGKARIFYLRNKDEGVMSRSFQDEVEWKEACRRLGARIVGGGVGGVTEYCITGDFIAGSDTEGYFLLDTNWHLTRRFKNAKDFRTAFREATGAELPPMREPSWTHLMTVERVLGLLLAGELLAVLGWLVFRRRAQKRGQAPFLA